MALTLSRSSLSSILVCSKTPTDEDGSLSTGVIPGNTSISGSDAGWFLIGGFVGRFDFTKHTLIQLCGKYSRSIYFWCELWQRLNYCRREFVYNSVAHSAMVWTQYIYTQLQASQSGIHAAPPPKHSQWRIKPHVCPIAACWLLSSTSSSQTWCSSEPLLSLPDPRAAALLLVWKYSKQVNWITVVSLFSFPTSVQVSQKCHLTARQSRAPAGLHWSSWWTDYNKAQMIILNW